MPGPSTLRFVNYNREENVVAIVINSFEAVAEAPEQQMQKQENSERESGNKSAIPDPQELAPVLHILAGQALRSWAH